jgi:hypothetical protein
MVRWLNGMLDVAAVWIDRAVSALVNRVPAWVVGVIVLAFYPGFGLLLPIALGWSGYWLLGVNFLGVFVAFVLGLGWLGPELQAARRRDLLDWSSDLRNVSGEEFEWLVGEVFQREGWNVNLTGKQEHGDGNIDLELTRGHDHKIVQCKAWQSWRVGVKEIRGFGGTLLRKSLPGEAGIFVTIADVSQDARKEAEEMRIELIDRAGLLTRMDRIRRRELCDTCHSPMRLARSQYGWWFRCVTPGCSGKRDLGPDARAIEFLTELR